MAWIFNSFLVFFLSFSSINVFAQVQQVQPWLGVEIDPKVMKEGILVKNVIPGAPAERAGFLSGDVLKAIDKERFNSRDALMSILRNKGVGTSVTVHLTRSGKDLTKTLKLEILPDMLDLAKANLLNKTAPSFELVSVTNPKKTYKNSDFAGKAFILEFWATWCPACRAAGPYLESWSKAHPNIPLLGLSDEAPEVISAYAKKEGITFMQTHDAEGKAQGAYGMGSIPAFILVGKDGKVVDLTVGGGEYLKALLQKAEKL